MNRLDKNVRLNGTAVSPADEDIYLVDVHVQSDSRELTNLAHQHEYEQVVTTLSAAIDQHINHAVEPPHTYTRRSPQAAARHSQFVAALREKLTHKEESVS